MQAAVYCRISHDPRGESLGVTRQLEDCTALAEQAGWTVAEVYTDNDISAASGSPRPAYQRMLADVQAGRIGAIIAWHPDRLYRRLRDLLDLTDIIEQHDTKIRTVRAGDVDLSTPSGQMLAQILGAVAQSEGKTKSERWRRSWRQRRELGHVTPAGWRTFGYTRDGEPLEAEADRLRQVFDDVLAGKALRAICAELNAEGWQTTREGRWEGTGLRVLLRNPRLAGYATYKGEIVGDGDWTPIVDRDAWQTVVAMLDARTTTARPRRWLLSGLIVCGECEAPLLVRKGRHEQRTYKCVKAEGGCGAVDGNAHRIEEVVESFAQTRLADDRVRQRLAEMRSGGQGHLLAEIEALQGRLTEVEQAMRQPGRSSLTSLLRAEDALRARIDSLQAQLVVTAPVTLPAGDEWPPDLGIRRRLVELVVARVLLDKSPTKGGRFRPERVRIDRR